MIIKEELKRETESLLIEIQEKQNTLFEIWSAEKHLNPSKGNTFCMMATKL